MNKLELLKSMIDMRSFDETCLEGVKTMEIHGELHTSFGQEAISAGIKNHINLSDSLVSTHRNHYHALIKGVDPFKLMSEIFEKETGICKGYGGHMHPFSLEHNFSATGIVGQSLPVALGYAYAFKIKKQNNISVCIMGDGASNQGTFHECLNIAGSWNLPLLLIIENNRYGISVPISEVIATPTISERAISYNAWGKTVNGLDPEVVSFATAEAINHIKQGKGPAIIETLCERIRGHYEGDPDHYRTKLEKDRNIKNDPISLYSSKLISEKIINDNELKEIKTKSKSKLLKILEKVRSQEAPHPKNAYNFVFVSDSK